MNFSITLNSSRGLIVTSTELVAYYDKSLKFGFFISSNFELNSKLKKAASNYLEQFNIDCSSWTAKFFPKVFICELISDKKHLQNIPLLKSYLGLSEISLSIALMKSFVCFYNNSDSNRPIRRDINRWYKKLSRLPWKINSLDSLKSITDAPAYDTELTRVYINETSILTLHFVRGYANLFADNTSSLSDPYFKEIFSNLKLELKVKILDLQSFDRLKNDISLNNFSMIKQGEYMDAVEADRMLMSSELKFSDPAIAFLHKKKIQSLQLN